MEAWKQQWPKLSEVEKPTFFYFEKRKVEERIKQFKVESMLDWIVLGKACRLPCRLFSGRTPGTAFTGGSTSFPEKVIVGYSLHSPGLRAGDVVAEWGSHMVMGTSGACNRSQVSEAARGLDSQEPWKWLIGCDVSGGKIDGQTERVLLKLFKNNQPPQ